MKFFVAIMLIISSVCHAERENFEKMVRFSDLIFSGEVVDVSFKVLDLGDSRTLPYTFVSYQVEESFKGGRESEVITLRFLGGKDSDGTYLHMSQTPLFEPGEKDIIFVVENGSKPCPLMGCSKGRFNVLDDGTVNVRGKTLIMSDVSAHQNDHIDNEVPDSPLRANSRLSAKEFSNFIMDSVALVHSDEELDQALDIFNNSDINEEINDSSIKAIFPSFKSNEPNHENDYDPIEVNNFSDAPKEKALQANLDFRKQEEKIEIVNTVKKDESRVFSYLFFVLVLCTLITGYYFFRDRRVSSLSL